MSVVQERRVRAILIPERHVVGLLLGFGIKLPHAVEVPVWDGVPAEGVELHAVYHEPHKRCFTAVVSHPSFDPVPDGMYAPEFPLTFHRKQVVPLVPEEPVVVPGGD
jgi:hypothetical protein